MRFWWARAVGVLVEKWDAENLDSWRQVAGWLKMRQRGLKGWTTWWKIDGMLVEKIFGDSGVWGMKWYAVGESSWEK